MSSTVAASGRGKRQKSKAYRSRTEKAGLIFPVGRIARFLKIGKYADRLSKDAPVYIAAVLEYMAIEVLELSGNLAKTNKKKQIGPREIQLAIRDDNELNKVVGNSIIPNAGVPPNIHEYLLPKIKGEKEVEIGSGSK